MMKRRFSFLLCTALACLCVSLLSPKAKAAEIIDSGYCGGEGDGTNLTWTLDNEGTLTISGEGSMADNLAFTANASVETVIVEDGITSIGKGAFMECDSLTRVCMPDSVTCIDDFAFNNCDLLNQIDMPDYLEYIGIDAFVWCYSLPNITIPPNVAFIYDSAFAGCSSLTHITVDDDNAWYADADGILYSKDLNTLICYPAGKKEAMFNIPEGVRSVGYCAFRENDYLEQIIIPDTVTTIEDYAFFSSTKLKSLTIPDSVTFIGDSAFVSCFSMNAINVDVNNSVFADVDGILYTKDMTTLVCCPAGYTISQIVVPEGVAVIGDRAFEWCRLRNVRIPNSVERIGDDAFSSCKRLTAIALPDSVTSIGARAFIYCGSLSSATLSNSLSIIGRAAFAHCTSLHEISVPSSVTKIVGGAFGDCSNLATVIFEGAVPKLDDELFYDTTTIAYYPADNSTWTADKLQDYDGDITWVPYTRDMIYHTRFLLDTIPQAEFDLEITVARLGDSANDVAMISLYSPEGKCLETVLWQLTDDVGQTYTLSRDNTDGKIGQIKVFILDGLSNPIPLAEAAEITSGT